MEIKDPIHGRVPVSEAEMRIIDSRVLQRLREIRQLGFAELSFPGATHTRYLHSLGVMHLASLAFDQCLRSFPFSSSKRRELMRAVVRLAALLHDIGHGPLSHTTERRMPPVDSLKVPYYPEKCGRQATHEDYTLKLLFDSDLTDILKSVYPEVSPLFLAALFEPDVFTDHSFFQEGGINLLPVLSQLVSSEIDVDRMDYLERDAYFCGTNYGRIETEWLISHLRHYIVAGRCYLALNRRALYTFDDFLISRHHMYLMIYFHHKSIIYEEMLRRYLDSDDCTYELPAEVEGYLHCTDADLHIHLSRSSNPWARRISERKPYRVLYEFHLTEETSAVSQIVDTLEKNGISRIVAQSSTRLSKYEGEQGQSHFPIFVVDEFNPFTETRRIEQCTQIFQKYQETRKIERVYVSDEDYQRSQQMVLTKILD